MSPLSISCALAMTYAGAGGATKQQLHQVLFGDKAPTLFAVEAPNRTDHDLHTWYLAVMEILNRDKSHKLHLANRVYAHRPFIPQLLNEFSQTLKHFYQSELREVDFGQGETVRAEINDWVGKKTEQKIRDLIPPGALTALTRMVLVNAIYFKGDWKTKFDPQQTHQRGFHVSENEEIQIDMMSMRNSKMRYNENESFQILGLPYAGTNLFMYILLPKERDGMAQVQKSLTGQSLLDAIAQSEVDQKMEYVAMPKFKLEESASLVDVLAKLGATDMFSEKNADFSNITGQKDLFVSDVIHKAFIEVNEEGTEAAAATGVVMNLRMAMPSSNPTFVADHPFLFTIFDNLTSSILFLGRYGGKK